jgi:hypothetical protein
VSAFRRARDIRRTGKADAQDAAHLDAHQLPQRSGHGSELCVPYACLDHADGCQPSVQLRDCRSDPEAGPAPFACNGRSSDPGRVDVGQDTLPSHHPAKSGVDPPGVIVAGQRGDGAQDVVGVVLSDRVGLLVVVVRFTECLSVAAGAGDRRGGGAVARQERRVFGDRLASCAGERIGICNGTGIAEGLAGCAAGHAQDPVVVERHGVADFVVAESDHPAPSRFSTKPPVS